MSILFNNVYQVPSEPPYLIYQMTTQEAQTYHESFQGGYIIKNSTEKFKIVWLRSNINTSYEYWAIQVYCHSSIMNLGQFMFGCISPYNNTYYEYYSDGQTLAYKDYGEGNSFYVIHAANKTTASMSLYNIMTTIADRYDYYLATTHRDDSLRTVSVSYDYSPLYSIANSNTDPSMTITMDSNSYTGEKICVINYNSNYDRLVEFHVINTQSGYQIAGGTVNSLNFNTTVGLGTSSNITIEVRYVVFISSTGEYVDRSQIRTSG